MQTGIINIQNNVNPLKNQKPTVAFGAAPGLKKRIIYRGLNAILCETTNLAGTCFLPADHNLFNKYLVVKSIFDAGRATAVAINKKGNLKETRRLLEEISYTNIFRPVLSIADYSISKTSKLVSHLKNKLKK